jgi:excisionase family DNA binding protein
MRRTRLRWSPTDAGVWSKAVRGGRKLAGEKWPKRGRKKHICTQNHGADALSSIGWLGSWPVRGSIRAKQPPFNPHDKPRSYNELLVRNARRRSSGTGRAFPVRVHSSQTDYTHSPAPQASEPRIGRSVSLDHAAELLGVSRRTIYNRIRSGGLQTIRTVGGSQRVLLDSVRDSRGNHAAVRQPQPLKSVGV